MVEGSFASVDPSVLERLRTIVGADSVLSDPEARSAYGRDETEDFSFPPEAVVRPRTRDEVARILELADGLRIPVTPRGAGTGLSGGALPVHGGIVLSMDRMSRLEIDTDNLVAVAEPGVITQVLQERAEAEGLFYPPDPASRGSCLIGGNLAHGAGGPRAVKYGTTRDYVLGVEAVVPGGRVIRSGGKLRKYASGYPLHQLLVSSEGTLAVITEVTLRLIPLPSRRRTLLGLFPSLSAALHTLVAILRRGVVPSAAEFLERDALDAAARHLGESPSDAQAQAMLLFEVDGASDDEVDGQAQLVGEQCLEGGADDVLLAADPPHQEKLWRMRRAVGEAVKSISTYREIDAVVPLSAIPEVVAGAKQRARAAGLDAICYGHAGDGNIHINVLKRDLAESEWRAAITRTASELYAYIASLGGAVSGEHGVGFVARGELSALLGEDTVAVMRAVKQAFDPHGILNPGKIF